MKTKKFRLLFSILGGFQYLPFLTRLFKNLRTPDAAELTQILVEAYNNAFLHGHKKNKNLWIHIDIEITPSKACIKILDQGSGFRKGNRTSVLKPWQTTGRGLVLIQAKADQITTKKKKGHHIFEAIRFYE